MFLANENFPNPSIEYLRINGHNIISIQEEMAAISDEQVIEMAQSQELAATFKYSVLRLPTLALMMFLLSLLPTNCVGQSYYPLLYKDSCSNELDSITYKYQSKCLENKFSNRSSIYMVLCNRLRKKIKLKSQSEKLVFRRVSFKCALNMIDFYKIMWVDIRQYTDSRPDGLMEISKFFKRKRFRIIIEQSKNNNWQDTILVTITFRLHCIQYIIRPID